MSFAAATTNSITDHGATIISGSPDCYINGLPVVRLGDLVSCPIEGHGINAIIAVQTMQQVNGRPMAHVMAVTACGATIIGGSPDTYVG